MPSPTNIGSELDAIYIYTALVGTDNDDLPAMNLDDATHIVPWDKTSDVLKPVNKLEIAEVISDFHALMGGLGKELQKEFDAQRITGAKYAETYVALTQAGLSSAVQFALGKDQAFWMSAKTQADAITAHNQNEIARLNAALTRANFALTKLKLATEDSQFGQGEYQRLTMMPAQRKLVDEQMEAQRGQTQNTRSSQNNTTTVDGILGAQKALYDQQKLSYVADTKIKAAKVFSDLWITRYTINQATNLPVQFDTLSPSLGLDNYNSIFGNLKFTAGGT